MPPTPSRRRWYHFRWWQILLLLVALLAGWFGIYSWLGHRELQAVQSQWDKLGRWRYADLIANQKPEEHNTVPSWVIRQARPITRGEFENEIVHYQPREYEPNLLLHADTIQYLRNRANGWPTFLEQQKELNTIPDKVGVGPLNTNPPWHVYSAYMNETRKVSYAMREQLWLALQEKNVPLTMELLRYEKRLALHQLAEPFMTNQKIGDDGLRWYLENIYVALAQVEFNDQQLRQLSVDLGNYDSRAAWQKYLLSEAGQTFHYLEYLSRSDTDILKMFGMQKSTEVWERFKQYVMEFRIRADLQSPFFRAEIMRSILNVYSQQEKPLLDLFRDLDAQNESLKKQRKGELDSRNLATPRLHYRLNTIMRLSATWQCTQIALAAEQFRLQHQRWPQSQDELIPKFLPAELLDPFDDKPLRLKTVDDGLLIYSVVGNSIDRQFTDDGGDIQRTDEKFTIKDTGVKLWNPAHRRKPAKPLERREEQE